MGRIGLLNEARAAGLVVVVDGDKLVVRGPPEAEPIARKLLASKREVMAALASIRSPSAAPVGADLNTTLEAYWRELFEERAALRQYEAGYRREIAERLAFGEIIEVWCRAHPQPQNPAICAGCGQPVAVEVLDLPDGARAHWERHREFACLIEAGLRRKQRALEALAAMGLAPPPGWEA